MKKQRLDKFNNMVSQHREQAQELCEMAGLSTDACDDFFSPPIKEPMPLSEKNGTWISKLWPFKSYADNGTK